MDITKIIKFATNFKIFASLDTNIKLTIEEEKIFNLLKEVINERSPNTVLRVAGGWVRDKLFGKNSNDIDISVNNMTGYQFAKLVNSYLEEKKIETNKVSIIEANPEQSKQLETATVKIFGYPIDFVNLRKEVYTTDSRIPTMEFGTPEEDAKRRDLTINSLFYNINEDKIEDFSNGIKDIEKRIAKTPDNPLNTFLEDPLRILRAVRFAAKFNLELDEELVRAANDPRVKDAFKNKISLKRVWQELAGKKEEDKYKPGALNSNDISKAVLLLKQLGLMELLFDPNDEEFKELSGSDNIEKVDWETDQNNKYHDFDIFKHTLNVVKNVINLTPNEMKEEHEVYLIRVLAALLHDIGKRYKTIQGKKDGFTTYHGHEELSGKIARVALNKLGASKKIIDRVVKLIDMHLAPHQLLDEKTSDKAYRKYSRDFADWKHSIDLAIADSLGKKNHSDEEEENIKNQYLKMKDKIEKLNIDNIKLPISGGDLMELGLRPGPKFKEIIDFIKEKVLEVPFLTKDEAIELIKDKFLSRN